MVRAVLCSNNRVDTDEASLDGLDEEGLFDALEAAQAELLSASEAQFTRTIAVQRLRRAAVLSQADFGSAPDDEASAVFSSDSAVAAEISQRAARRDQLSAHHAELHANVASLETELEQLRTEKFRLRHQIREHREHRAAGAAQQVIVRGRLGLGS